MPNLNNSVLVPEAVTGGATVSSGAPESPVTGALWFDSDDGKVYVYYDNFWVEIGGNPLAISISASAPANPITGQIWFNTSNAGTYIYYDNFWVEIGGTPLGAIVSSSAPASPLTGQIWYNSDDAGAYIYYDGYWVEIGAAPFNTLISTIDAKGDLLVGTANDTIGRLAVGTNGYVLGANSSTGTGLEWVQVSSNPLTSNAAAIFIMDIGA